MNTQVLAAIALIPTFLFGSFQTEANAARGGSSPNADRVISTDRPETSASQSFDLQMVWYHHDPDLYSFGISVDGEIYNVEVTGDSRQGSLSLNSRSGDFIVGYAGTRKGITVFDEDGLVESAQGRDAATSIESYGPAALILSDPAVLIAMADAYDGTWSDNGPAGHPVLWALGALALRCLDAEFTYNSNGSWSGSVGWDC